MTYCNSLLTATLTEGLLGVLFGQSNRKPMPEPKFSELSKDEAARLEQQRVAAKRSGTASLPEPSLVLTVLLCASSGELAAGGEARGQAGGQVGGEDSVLRGFEIVGGAMEVDDLRVRVE